MDTESPATVQHSPRPPPQRQSRRLSVSFRKINQAVGTITHVNIFSGSLTGTSDRFASSLAEKAVQCGADVSLKSLEDFDPGCFNNDPKGSYHSTSRATVFVVSTHFAGGPSPNAEIFSQWLRLASGDVNAFASIDSVLPEETRPTDATLPVETDAATEASTTTQGSSPDSTKLRQRIAISPNTARKPRRQSSFSAAVRPLLRMNWRNAFNNGNGSLNTSKPKNPLQGVQYAVFGVGNSMYLTYNAMGKFVDARMQALGAVRLCPLGLGDVSKDIDDAFVKWEAHFLQLLAFQKPGPPTGIAVDAHDPQESTLEQHQSTPNTNKGEAIELTRATNVSPLAPNQRYLEAISQESEASSPCQPTDEPGKSASFTASAAITGTGSPVRLLMQDHYGRHVRLRFRCRYVNTQEAKPPTDTKLPMIAKTKDTQPQRKLSRRHTSVRRDATHIRHPCFALQAITMLKRNVGSGDCQSNASALKEISLARLAILDSDLTFETADTFGYFPPNPKDTVDAIGSKLGLDMDAYVELSFHDGEPAPSTNLAAESAAPSAYSKNRHLPFPSPCRIRTILSDFLELRAISREFVRVASGFVTDHKEHELLENMASIDGSAAFNREFAQTKSGMLKLLDMAPSLRMPFEVFVNITPLLKPRLYSIASTHFKNDREFDIVVALGNPNEAHGLSVSNFRRILSKSEIQLPPTENSTNHNSNAPAEAAPASAPVLRMLRGFVAASRFKPPSDLSVPTIMIGNGIGIAPFRALLQHREFEVDSGNGDLARQQKVLGTADSARTPTSLSCGKNLLLLGCSTKNSTLFESELRDWESKGLLEFHVAHSSEPEQPAQHVQDLVAAHKQKIAALMASSPEARIYICGKVAMARAVHQILAAQDTTNSWYQKALQSGRYIEGIFE